MLQHKKGGLLDDYMNGKGEPFVHCITCARKVSTKLQWLNLGAHLWHRKIRKDISFTLNNSANRYSTKQKEKETIHNPHSTQVKGTIRLHLYRHT
jgi:hypothetical protein